jgi:hypothetical protein
VIHNRQHSESIVFPVNVAKATLAKKGRHMVVWFSEKKAQFKTGSSRKIKIAQDAYEDGHRVGCVEARILEIKRKSRCMKYKKSAHMAFLTNPIRQPILDISPIWILLISNEFTNSQRRSV